MYPSANEMLFYNFLTDHAKYMNQGHIERKMAEIEMILLDAYQTAEQILVGILNTKWPFQTFASSAPIIEGACFVL